MLRSTASKVMWVGRATVFLVGLAVILAVVFGAATTAFGANGDFFKVGRSNFASALSTLDKSGAGPALRLLVDSGPPLAVNSGAKVTNLNADKVDGKDSAAFALANRTPMWAVVNSDGTLRRSSPGVTSSTRISTANYQVTFDRNVDTCAYLATIEGPANGEIAVSRSTNFDTAQQMRVNPVPDSAFHLVVFC